VMIEELASKYGFDSSKIKIEYMGVRPGEKISEGLITEEETEHLEEADDLFILRPSIITPGFVSEFHSKKNYKQYNSNNIVPLTKEKIRKLLYYYNIIE